MGGGRSCGAVDARDACCSAPFVAFLLHRRCCLRARGGGGKRPEVLRGFDSCTFVGVFTSCLLFFLFFSFFGYLKEWNSLSFGWLGFLSILGARLVQ